MRHEFTREELAEIKQRYPKLKQGVLGPFKTWEGVVNFNKSYREYPIVDSFGIKIVLPDNYPNQIPWVQETGGRIEKIAKKYGITDLRDLHVNPSPKDRTVCLCVKQEEKIKFPPGSKLPDFIENLVVPYFYGISYFEENRRWPWREYSHGGLGMLECYAEDSAEQTEESLKWLATVFTGDTNWKKYRGQVQNPKEGKVCVCGSGKPFIEHHNLAWRGLMKMHEDIRRLKLNAYKLFSKK
jgi:hypothetical protein